MLHITKELMQAVGGKRKHKDFHLEPAMRLDADLSMYVNNGGQLSAIEEQLWMKLCDKIIGATPTSI